MENHTESEKNTQSRTRIHKFSLLPCEKIDQIRSFFWSVFWIQYLSEFRSNFGKYRPKKTPYLDTFHAVLPKCQNKNINKPGRRRKLSFRSFNSFNSSIKKEFFIVSVRLKTCIFFLDLSERFGMSATLISKDLCVMNNFFVSWVAIIFPLSFTKITEKVFTKKFWKISNNTNTYWWKWNFSWKNYFNENTAQRIDK